MTLETVTNEIVEKLEPKFCLTKLTEELLELGEICMKMVNKKPDKAPPMSSLIEEMGDVQVRMNILSIKLGICNLVNDRVTSKTYKILQYLKQYSQA